MEERARVTGAWSSHEDAILVREYNARGRWRDRVARQLGRSCRSIYCRLRLLRSRGAVGLHAPMAAIKWKTRVPYSSTEIVELRALAARGASNAEIAHHLGRTPGSVRRKAAKCGITIHRRITMPSGERVYNSPGAWSEAEITQLRAAVARGISTRRIASEFGRSYKAVMSKMHRLGLATGRHVWSAEDEHRLSLAFYAGLSDRSIAERYGWSLTALRAHRYTMGLVLSDRKTRGKS